MARRKPKVIQDAAYHRAYRARVQLSSALRPRCMTWRKVADLWVITGELPKWLKLEAGVAT